MSESRSSTVALTFAPPARPGHRPFVLATTPGRTRSLTSATARNAPRAFATRTSSPLTMPQGGVVGMDGGCSTHRGVLPPSNVERPEPAQKPDHLAHGRRHCLRGQEEDGAPSRSLRVLWPPDAAAAEAEPPAPPRDWFARGSA